MPLQAFPGHRHRAWETGQGTGVGWGGALWVHTPSSLLGLALDVTSSFSLPGVGQEGQQTFAQAKVDGVGQGAVDERTGKLLKNPGGQNWEVIVGGGPQNLHPLCLAPGLSAWCGVGAREWLKQSRADFQRPNPLILPSQSPGLQARPLFKALSLALGTFQGPSKEN